MKKKSIIFLVFIFSFPVLAQTTLLRGKVTLQNSNGKPVENVQLSAFGATPTSSDTFGMFELVFIGKVPGQAVTLTIQKPGMEVINRDELEHFILRKDPDDLFIIVLCSEGNRDKNAAQFYNIVLKFHENQIEEIKKEISKLPISSSRVIELQNQIKKLTVKWQDSQDVIKKLSEKFASVNLDDADSLYSKAFEYFKTGETEKAHLILLPETLKKNIDDAKAELNKIKQLENEMEERRRLAQKNIKKTIEGYILKAELYISQLKWEEAEKYYELAVLADTTSFDNMFDLAYYLSEQNKHKKAIFWYETALNLFKNEYQHSVVLNNLAVLYSEINDYSLAETTYKRALDIRERLAKENPITYEPDVAITLNNLAVLYSEINDYSLAETTYKRALDIRERLAEENPSTYKSDVAMTLNNLAILYKAKNDYSSAKIAYKKALEIRERLAEENSGKYEADVASTLNNLANLYFDINDYSSAETAYKRALEIREHLAEKNPSSYEPDVANTLNNLANLYLNKCDYSSAEAAYKRALEIQERLALENPYTYESYVATTLNNLAILYSDKNDYFLAEIAYKKTLEIRERLAEENPHTYEPDLAHTLNNLATLYSNEDDYLSAEFTLKKALEIYDRIVENNPCAYELNLANTLNNLAILYLNKKDYSQACISCKRALEIRKKVYCRFQNENTSQQLVNSYGNLSWFLLFDKSFVESEKYARAGLEFKSSENLKKEFEWINSNLAAALLLQGKFNEAKRIYMNFKGKDFDVQESWNDIFINDLDELEKAGITHKDVLKIRELLK